MTFQKQVLERIRMQKVRPTPKGLFKVRDITLWTLLGVFVAALSIGFGMIIFMVKGTDLTLFEKLGLSTYQRFAYSIPTFWIGATIILGGVAYANFYRTRTGYRVNPRQFALIALLISVAMGSIIYSLNITGYVDSTASKYIPHYNSVVPLNTSTWFDPVHGLLSGTVKEVNSDRDFTLRDSNSVLWTIKGNGVVVPSDYSFHPGDRIKIIGKQVSEDTFSATEITPWQ